MTVAELRKIVNDSTIQPEMEVWLGIANHGGEGGVKYDTIISADVDTIILMPETKLHTCFVLRD